MEQSVIHLHNQVINQMYEEFRDRRCCFQKGALGKLGRRGGIGTESQEWLDSQSSLELSVLGPGNSQGAGSVGAAVPG